LRNTAKDTVDDISREPLDPGVKVRKAREKEEGQTMWEDSGIDGMRGRDKRRKSNFGRTEEVNGTAQSSPAAFKRPLLMVAQPLSNSIPPVCHLLFHPQKIVHMQNLSHHWSKSSSGPNLPSICLFSDH
jgi:hypothetical protein